MEWKISFDEVRYRLELALKPAEPPVLDEVLAAVEKNGRLHGPVDQVFSAWRLYVEYAAQEIAETFQLTEEERRTLLNFRDAVKTLLTEAQRQAREKLAALYKAVAEGNYRLEGGKLFAPDGTWMYTKALVPRILIHGINASARFPDVLKLPRKRLELLQLGWRASDESEIKGRPFMGTTQPWQVFAWAATRCGAFRIHIESVNLTREGVSVSVHLRANSWRQRWSKDEAVDLVINHFRRGEWAPLLTMWLGDGKVRWGRIGRFEIAVAAKAPQRLGKVAGDYEAIVAKGKEMFKMLDEAAGPYGVLLDALRSHKWLYIKETVSRKRTVEILREAVGSFHQADPVRILESMKLSLVSGNGGTLIAAYYTSSAEEAVAAADALEALRMRPNVVKSNRKYVVYVGLSEIKKNEELRKVATQFLAEKMRSGTPKQQEIARRIVQRNPDFFRYGHYQPSKAVRKLVAGPGLLGGFSPEPGTSGSHRGCPLMSPAAYLAGLPRFRPRRPQSRGGPSSTFSSI